MLFLSIPYGWYQIYQLLTSKKITVWLCGIFYISIYRKLSKERKHYDWMLIGAKDRVTIKAMLNKDKYRFDLHQCLEFWD